MKDTPLLYPEKAPPSQSARAKGASSASAVPTARSPEVASHPERAAIVDPQPKPPGMLALIDRFGRDPSVDVEKYRVLLGMRREIEAHDAELAFNAAKGRILKKLALIKIVKNRSVLYEIEKGKPNKGHYEAFKYAPLEEIDRHLRPLLSEEDMDLSYSNEPREGGGVLVRGRLKHLPGGHYEDSFMPAPLDTSGGKSNVQGVGSTNSFLRRYIACNIFNIVVIGDDDDGTGGTIDEVQVKAIRSLLEQTGSNEAAFLKYLKAPSIEAIPYRAYPKAMSALEEKIAKNANTAQR